MAKIVDFARDHGAFRTMCLDDLNYIGDNINEFKDITFHELLFLDMFGNVETVCFKVSNDTGEIVPYESGPKFIHSGFSPREMYKKLAIVEAAKKQLTA